MNCMRGALLLLVAACGSSLPKPNVVAPAPPAPPPPPHPARVYPLALAQGASTLRPLPDGGQLVLGPNGERARAKDNKLVALATTWANEPIAGFVPREKGLRFITVHGSIYDADDALGPLRLVERRHGREAAAGKHHLLFIDERGVLFRGGAGPFSEVHLPRGGGATQLAMNERGEGVVILAPAEAFVTRDDGATWSAGPALGAGNDVTRAEDGTIALVTGGETFVLGSAGFGKADLPDPISFGDIPGPAVAVVGTKAYGHRQTFEVSAPFGPRTDLGPTSAACWNPHTVAAGNVVEQLCFGGMDFRVDGQTLWTLHRSEDGGKTFRADGRLLYYEERDVAMWMSPDGDTLLVKGTCDFDEAPCDGRGVIRRKGDARFSSFKVDSGTLPSLYEVVWGAGAQVFAVGSVAADEDKSRGPRLFTSADGGRSFKVEALPARVPVPHPQLNADHPDHWPLKYVKMIGEPNARSGAIAVDAAGSLSSFVVSERSRERFFVKEGSALVERPLPAEGKPSFAGLHGLLGGGDALFETHDGGRSWTRLDGLPLHAAPRCTRDGCLLGEVAYRHGWDDTAPVAASPAPPPSMPPMLVCDAGAFTEVPVPAGRTIEAFAKGLDDARLAWAMVASDGAVTARTGSLDDKGLVFREGQLLPASKERTWVVLQSPSGRPIAARQSGKGKAIHGEFAWLDRAGNRRTGTSPVLADAPSAWLVGDHLVLADGSKTGALLILDGKKTVELERPQESAEGLAGSRAPFLSMHVGNPIAYLQLLGGKSKVARELDLWPVRGGYDAQARPIAELFEGPQGFGLATTTGFAGRPVFRIELDADLGVREVVRLPTLAELDPLPGCTSKDAALPAITLPAEGAPHRAVRIDYGGRALWLATGDVRVRLREGGKVCVQTLTLETEDERAFVGVVSGTDLRGLLRRQKKGSTTEAASLRCRFEPAKEVPAMLLTREL